jgi:alpha-N-arabinofuranosidase
VTFEAVADEASYRFSIATGGTATTTLGTLPTEGLSAERVAQAGHDHFTGAVIGLYATGNGHRASSPADFDWFESAPL